MDYSEGLNYGEGEINVGKDEFPNADDFQPPTEYSQVNSILTDAVNGFGVTAVTFDFNEELIWMGNQGGHVTSYYGTDMQKYTSFRVHSSNEVRQIITTDAGILALTSSSLRAQARRGLPIFSHSSEIMQEMQCMLLTSPTMLLIGGHQENVIEFDITRTQEARQIDVGPSGCAILRHHSRYICAGDTSGKVTLRDPHSLTVEHTFEAHPGTLSDFDVHGNLLVTCGFSSRLGNLTVDRFLKVYDLRVNRAVSPIPVMVDPLLLRFVPTFTSRLAVLSQIGQLQFVETGSLSESSIYQVNTAGAACMTFDVSNSCQAFAFGDAGGCVHLFTTSGPATFNPFSQPTEFADPVETLPPLDINDKLTPVSTIPMPYCSGKLLSDWPAEFCKVAYRRTPPVDPEILRTMKVVHSIGYAPNPGTRLRNQVPYKLDCKNRAKNKSKNPESHQSADDINPIVPKRYQKIEMKNIRPGSEEAEYMFYNSTSFSGLESNLPNAYCNAMLQVLYYVEPLNVTLKNHLCSKEFCLACELGFLFHMLDVAQGMPCQANNVLRAFRTIPEASGLGLILTNADESGKKPNLCRLIQNWNRFILLHIHTETAVQADSSSDEASNSTYDLEPKSCISQHFGTNFIYCNRCKCGNAKFQDSTAYVFSLLYPDASNSNGVQTSFAEVLKRSLCLEQTTQAWCDKCDKYQPTTQSRKLKNLPDILALNCGMDSANDLNFWKAQTNDDILEPSVMCNTGQKKCHYGETCSKNRCKFLHLGQNPKSVEYNKEVSPEDLSRISWIPPGIKIKLLEDGQLELQDIKSFKQEDDEPDVYIFHLMAVVCHIKDPNKSDMQNLVSFVKVGPSYHQRSTGSMASRWYIFNDFSVTPTTEEEVLWFSLEWKVPCVLYFAKRTPVNEIGNSKCPITLDVFREDKSLANLEGYKRITFTPLGIGEKLANSDLVAMDAEFVSLNQEESEIRSDGTKSTIKPSQMAVARITCIRGQGPIVGTPFIDDYISTQEQVVDYLTKFSGIMPGDLDASLSSKHLTTLKSTYLKLRFLVDTGVKFIGHGLKNDFRVINIVVPPEQVIDTVHLFHQPNQRMISLRFLAWHFLGLKIQSIIHDSIEDARTALKLYHKYKEMEAEGRVKEALKELYDKGHNLQWKIPLGKD